MLIGILMLLTACNGENAPIEETFDYDNLAFKKDIGSKLDFDTGIELLKDSVFLFQEFEFYKNNDEQFGNTLLDFSKSIQEYKSKNETDKEIIAVIKIGTVSLAELDLKVLHLFQLESQKELNIGNITEADIEKAKGEVKIYEGYAQKHIDRLKEYFELSKQ
jgi:hypothetical protein